MAVKKFLCTMHPAFASAASASRDWAEDSDIWMNDSSKCPNQQHQRQVQIPTNDGIEVVFVDSGVDAPELLMQGVLPGIEAHVLRLGQDPVVQMTEILQARGNVQRVHLVSHGSPGCLHLGDTELSLKTIDHYAAQLKNWFTSHLQSYTSHFQLPSLLLYGCNIAVGDAGKKFLEKIHRYTHAGIAASKDITGHANQRGNWELAEQLGAVEGGIAFDQSVADSYEYALNGVQLGQDINGISENERSGNSVSISADGYTIAIGARLSNSKDVWSGQVRIYRFNKISNQWTQLGNDLDGEDQGEQSGYAISLSSDGSTIAIGAPFNDGSSILNGLVRIYRFDDSSNQWSQLGTDLDGEAEGDRSGASVSLSADGSTIAIASGDNNNNRGHVRIYRFNLSRNQWTQLGADLDGETEGDRSGESVSLSADGSTIAIGAPYNNDNGFQSGHVRLYNFDDSSNQWLQLGEDLDGEAAGDLSGSSVSLSANGSIVAIGATNNDDNGSNSGQVRLFQNINGTWTQIGDDIDGEAAGDLLGSSVSLSANGSIVAISATNNDDNGSNSGQVRLFQNINGTWTQIGDDINGEAAGDLSGSSVSLSADGSVIAIGAPNNDENGSNSGQVRLYRLNTAPTNSIDLASSSNSNSIWLPIGDDIDGEAAGDQSGWSVALSADGSVVAIGAIGNDSDAGHVRLYSNDNNTWAQIGGDIDGEAAGDQSGWSVALSADGSVVAIGAKANDSNGGDAGHVRLYRNDSGTWIQIGGDIDGEAAGDLSGYSVALSADGSVVAIGAIRNDGNASNAGHVRLYRNDNGIWTQIGDDIDGEAAVDLSGYSVALSADGSLVAIGAIFNDANGSGAGHMRLFSNNNGTWTQIGNDIDGEGAGDQLGQSVALSADGSVVAIGANGNGANVGHVRLYHNDSGAWTQIGDDIAGEAAGDQSGYSIALSADGSVIAIGATGNNGNNGKDSNVGHVRLYRNDNGTWVKIGDDIDGEAARDQSGHSVTLSADGSVVAIGAIGNDSNGDLSGHVQLYRQGIGINENTSVSLSGISVSDADNNLATTQLSVTNGALTVDLASGATISSGTNNSNDLTLNGSETQINAALATLTYQGNLNFSGSDTLTIVSTDSTGSASTADTVDITIVEVNDAPTLTNNASLNAIPEDTTNPTGETVTNLFGSVFSDPDAAASLGGIAVVGNTANTTTEGTWQYSTNSGTTWLDVGTVADDANAALALSAATSLRFLPAANYDGTPPALILRALDNTYSGGFTSGSTRQTIDTSNSGSSSSIAASTNTLSTGVTPLNDPPVINDQSFDVYDSALNNSAIGTVESSDVDGDSRTYAITAGNTDNAFAIDASSGELTVVDQTQLNPENNETYNLTVEVTDDGTGSLTDTASITVNVKTKFLFDFDQDGFSDIIRDNSIQFLTGENGNNIAQTLSFTYPEGNRDWDFGGIGDFNNDGQPDWVIRNASSGSNAVVSPDTTALSDRSLTIESSNILPLESRPANFSLRGVGDIDGDGQDDLIWNDTTTGQYSVWYMNTDQTKRAETDFGPAISDQKWQIEAVVDFTGDAKADIFLRNSFTGQNIIWAMDGSGPVQSINLPRISRGWEVQGIGDYNRDKKTDLLWYNDETQSSVAWLMDRASIQQRIYLNER